MTTTIQLTPKNVNGTKFFYITSAEQVDVMLDDLRPAETLEIDTETMRPPVGSRRYEGYFNIYNQHKTDGFAPFDPHTAMVRLVQLRSRTSLPYVVDLLKVNDSGHRKLAKFLKQSGRTYLGHNIQFDLKHIASSLGVWLPKVQCSMQMSILIANALGGGERGHNLAANARDFLGIDLDKTEQHSDWAEPNLTDDQLEYAALDVTNLHDLHDVLKETLVDQLGMGEPFELEMAVLPACARMEFRGIPVDTEMIKKVQAAAHDALPQLLQDIGYHFKDRLAIQRAFINGKWWRVPWINLGSKKDQVLPILREYGLDIENCQRATLEAYRDMFPGVGALIDYYNVEKQSQFDYLKYVHPITGRIHSKFKPSAASTGRFASTDPKSCWGLAG